MAGAPDLTAVMAQLVKQQQDAEQQRAEFKIVLAQLLQAKDTSKQHDSLTLQSSTTDSVSRADFNRVLDELTRDREEARKDSREQLAQAHRRELENKEREKEFLEASLKRELERDADNKEREKEILEVSLKRELEREMMIRDESRQRDVDNREREKIIREEAREQRQEMANLYQMMLQTQQNENQTQIQTQMIQMPVQTNSQVHADNNFTKRKLDEQQKEISSLHKLLNSLQRDSQIAPSNSPVVHFEPSQEQVPPTTTTVHSTQISAFPPTSNPPPEPEPEPEPEPITIAAATTTSTTTATTTTPTHPTTTQSENEKWQAVAERLYSKRSNSHLRNYEQVTEILAANPTLFAPLLERCPNIGLIIAHLLKLRLGLIVQSVSWTTSISTWNGEDCRR